jgi:hypothetical protein
MVARDVECRLRGVVSKTDQLVRSLAQQGQRILVARFPAIPEHGRALLHGAGSREDGLLDLHFPIGTCRLLRDRPGGLKPQKEQCPDDLKSHAYHLHLSLCPGPG